MLEACKQAYDANYGNCSGFVRAVAEQFGIFSLGGRADTQLGYMAKNWPVVQDGKSASEYAAQGWLVVAGLSSFEFASNPNEQEGHVVVVVDGTLAKGKYPAVWAGSTGTAQSRGKTLNWSFKATDLDKVHFYRSPELPCARRLK